MPEKNYCLYIHTNRENGKKYVGITNDIGKRWRHGGIAYKPYGRENSRPFWNAICKYGFDAFNHEVVLYGLTFEEACEMEKKYIADLETQDRSKGYNVAEGGNGGRIYTEHPRGMLGKHHDDGKKEQSARVMKQNWADGLMGWKNGHPKGMLGKHHTAEHNAAMSERMKGRIVSEETRKRMGAASKGRRFTEEQRKRMSEVRKGKHKGAENVLSKPVIYVLNGIEYHADCRQQVVDELGISTTMFDMIRKSGQPYVPRGRSLNIHAALAGLEIRYA